MQFSNFLVFTSVILIFFDVFLFFFKIRLEPFLGSKAGDLVDWMEQHTKFENGQVHFRSF